MWTGLLRERCRWIASGLGRWRIGRLIAWRGMGLPSHHCLWRSWPRTRTNRPRRWPTCASNSTRHWRCVESTRSPLYIYGQTPGVRVVADQPNRAAWMKHGKRGPKAASCGAPKKEERSSSDFIMAGICCEAIQERHQSILPASRRIPHHLIGDRYVLAGTRCCQIEDSHADVFRDFCISQPCGSTGRRWRHGLLYCISQAHAVSRRRSHSRNPPETEPCRFKDGVHQLASVGVQDTPPNAAFQRVTGLGSPPAIDTV